MSDTFDPYHKWLGIPPSEQPPNHYRLLGVGLFEPDADVIDAAANQRMSYLQDMATGPHMDDSQRLLNEIAAARLALLKPAARAEYDAQLQAHIDASKPPESAPAAAAAPEPAAPPAAPALSPMMLLSVGSIAVVTLIIGLVFVFRGGGGVDGEANSARIKIVWKLDQREGAFMMIDRGVQFDSENTFPKDTETLIYKIKPGQHRFRFERKGYRPISFSDKFLPQETMKRELNWRPL
jgi:hypothetical protein